MVKNQDIAVLDFAVRVRGFSAMECSAFRCVIAPLVRQAKPGFSTELKNEQHDKKVSNM